MQQATVNLFADMWRSRAPGMGTLATARLDRHAPPRRDLGAPRRAVVGEVIVSATASDAGGGVVAGVEVSLDTGSTWRRAASTSWTYTFTPRRRHGQLRARAVDDSANLPSTRTESLVGPPPDLPLHPLRHDRPRARRLRRRLRVRAGHPGRPTIAGTVTGVRFWKSSRDTGTHTGSLWSTTGCARHRIFSGESACVSADSELRIRARSPPTRPTSSLPHGRGPLRLRHLLLQQERHLLPHLSLGLPDGLSGGKSIGRAGATGFPTDSHQASELLGGRHLHR